MSINYNNITIYSNRNTEFDKLLLEELKRYSKEIIIIQTNNSNQIIDDYQMLVQAMYLTKYIVNSENKDLSKVDYSPIAKKLYKYNKDYNNYKLCINSNSFSVQFFVQVFTYRHYQ